MVTRQKQKLDFYGLLETEKSATVEQIKTQYRRLALRWHPDKNNNSEEATEKFKLISEAYSVLSNPQRRKHYDKYGTVDDDMSENDDFFAHFEDMFRGGHGDGDDFFSHFDEYTTFLESDTKFMRNMFRDMGKDVRVKGKRRKQGGGAMRAGGRGGGMMEDMDMAFGMSMAMGGGDIEDMMAFMMMGGMMGGGSSKPSKKSKAKAKKQEDDGWDTEEEESDDDNKNKKKDKKEDDGWETVSDEDQ
eukprot:403342909